MTEYGIAYISKLRTSKLIKAWFNDNKSNSTKNCIVNCNYNTRFNKWEVLSIEENKNIPSKYDFIKKLEN